MARRTIAQFAHEYLIEKGFDIVGYGDTHLLHEIADYSGREHNSWKTEMNILNALERAPALFEKHYFRANRGLARVFKVKHGESIPQLDR